MSPLQPGTQRVFRLQSRAVAAKPRYAAPEPEQIAAWMDAYQRIGQYELSDIPFYCHPLTRGEYRICQSMAGDDEGKLEELLCARGCLWPLSFDFTSTDIPAGVPTALARQLRNLSGFTPESRDALFQKWQERAYDQDERHDMLIEIAYPHFSHADLDNMLADEYYHYLAKAEFRIKTQLLTSLNPEFTPDELVDLLLMPREPLEERLAQAQETIDQIMAEQQTLAAQQQQQQQQARRGGNGGHGRRPRI